ncbi:MAG: hypothetical protein RMY29_009095 [Nostoc sp. CreGUA01]
MTLGVIIPLISLISPISPISPLPTSHSLIRVKNLADFHNFYQ